MLRHNAVPMIKLSQHYCNHDLAVPSNSLLLIARWSLTWIQRKVFDTFVLLLFCLCRHDDGHFLSHSKPTQWKAARNTESAVPNLWVTIFLASWLLTLWSFFFKICSHSPLDRDFSMEAATVVCKLSISIDSIPSLGCLSLSVEEQDLGPTCSPAPAWVVSSKVQLPS